MSGADELAHLMKHAADQGTGGYRGFVYGHIANYDKNLNRVRVLIPSMRDESSGVPALSGWMPLGSTWVGPGGTGMQVAPYGGATPQNPTAGELCIITLIERERGVTAAVNLVYSDAMPPPGSIIPIESGEALLRGPGGTIFHFHADGSLEMTTPTDMNLGAAAAIVATTPSLTVSGNLSAGNGANGNFTSSTGQVITVVNGIVTNID